MLLLLRRIKKMEDPSNRMALFYQTLYDVVKHNPLPVLPTFSMSNVFLSFAAIIFGLNALVYLYRLLYISFLYRVYVLPLRVIIKESIRKRVLTVTNSEAGAKLLQLVNRYLQMIYENNFSRGHHVVENIVHIFFTVGYCTVMLYYVKVMNPYLEDKPTFNSVFETDLFNSVDVLELLNAYNNNNTSANSTKPEQFNSVMSIALTLIGLSLILECVFGINYYIKASKKILRWDNSPRSTFKCFSICLKLFNNRIKYESLLDDDEEDIIYDTDDSADDDDEGDYEWGTGGGNANDMKTRHRVRLLFQKLKVTEEEKELFLSMLKNSTCGDNADTDNNDSSNGVSRNTSKLRHRFLKDKSVFVHKEPKKHFAAAYLWYNDRNVSDLPAIGWFVNIFVGMNVHFTFIVLLYIFTVDIIFVFIGSHYAGRPSSTAVYGEFIVYCLLLIHLIGSILITLINATVLQGRNIVLPLSSFIVLIAGIIVSVSAEHPNRWKTIDLVCCLILALNLVVCTSTHFLLTSKEYHKRSLFDHGKQTFNTDHVIDSFNLNGTTAGKSTEWEDS